MRHVQAEAAGDEPWPSPWAYRDREGVVPEGHLIHRYAAEQERVFGGRQVRVSSPQGKFAEGACRLDGCRLARIEAYGKHLFYWWEDGLVLHVHLGMGGKYLDAGEQALPQARLRMTADDQGIELVAPSVCELLRPKGRDVLVERLGPDPLRRDAEPAAAWPSIACTSRPIGDLLLNQAVLSGVGNVLRNEALFVAGMHPLVRGDTLTESRFRALWAVLVAMMRQAMAEGRIITVRPAGRTAAEIPETEGRYVYKQERCRRCGTLVEVYTVGGRAAYACPADQPRPAG